MIKEFRNLYSASDNSPCFLKEYAEYGLFTDYLSTKFATEIDGNLPLVLDLMI